MKGLSADGLYLSLLTNNYVLNCVLVYFGFRCSMLQMYILSTLDTHRFSFATDIARGMAYIHSFKIYHGHLKSSNCVVDDRWTVKIAGGLSLLDLLSVRMMSTCTWYKGGKISITPNKRKKKNSSIFYLFLKRETYGYTENNNFTWALFSIFYCTMVVVPCVWTLI